MNRQDLTWHWLDVLEANIEAHPLVMAPVGTLFWCFVTIAAAKQIGRAFMRFNEWAQQEERQ